MVSPSFNQICRIKVEQGESEDEEEDFAQDELLTHQGNHQEHKRRGNNKKLVFLSQQVYEEV